MHTNLCKLIQKCAYICDAPPNEFHIPIFTNIDRYAITKCINDHLDAMELKKQGFGGIYNVGKAGIHPPHLIHLQYTPPFQLIALHW